MDMIKDALIYWLSQALRFIGFVLLVLVLIWLVFSGGNRQWRYFDYGDYDPLTDSQYDIIR